MRQTDAYIYDKERALLAAADKEKFLRAECERMVKENDKLRYLQSQNVTIRREVSTKLDEDLQSMTLSEMSLTINLEIANTKINWIEKSLKDFYKLLINAK